MTDRKEIFRIVYPDAEAAEASESAGGSPSPVYASIGLLDDNYPVRTFFTTKIGGASKGEFESLNMGPNTGDDIEIVKENRKRVFDLFGNAGYTEVMPQQVHGHVVQCIRKEDIARLSHRSEKADTERLTHCSERADVETAANTEIAGDEKKSAETEPFENILYYPETDATITDAKNVILTSLHADCIPVWLYDPVRHAAGLAHAGWRGTHADIAALTAKAMCREFGSKAEDIRAVIGPGIDMCCFETGEDVKAAFEEKYGEDFFLADSGNSGNPGRSSRLGRPRHSGRLGHYDPELCRDDKNGKFHLNLKNINKKLLLRVGIRHIEISGLCTSCREDIFYSYRRDHGKTGRMCAGIVLL